MMKYLYILILPCLLGLVSCNNPNDPIIENIAPNKDQTAGLYILDYKTEELRKIADLISVGMKNNKEWVLKQLKKSKPGEPLPYNRNFGITKKEYDIFIKYPKRNFALKKKEDVYLKVKRSFNRVEIRLQESKILAKGLIINLDTLKLTIENFGSSEKPAIFNTKESPMGDAKGYMWKINDPWSNGEIFMVQDVKTKSCWLTVNLVKLLSGNPVLKEEFSIKYNCCSEDINWNDIKLNREFHN